MQTVFFTAPLSERYHDTAKSIRLMASYGVTYYDRSFGGPSIDREDYRENNRSISALARSLGMVCSVAHAPFPTTALDPEKGKLYFTRLTRAMECAAMYGAPAIVIHPCDCLFPFTEHRDECLERSYRLYRDLLPYAQEYGLKICTENLIEWNNERHGCLINTCGLAEDFCQVIDAVSPEWMAACLDIGHCTCTGNDPVPMIHALGKKRLFMLHVHDNDGYRDLHQIPYLGSTDWAAVTKALGEIGFDGLLDFECEFPIKTCAEDLIPTYVDLVLKTGASLERKIRAAYPTV